MADNGSALGSFAAVVLPLAGAGLGFLVTWARDRAREHKAKLAEIYAALLQSNADNSGPKRMTIGQKQMTGQPLSDDEIDWLDGKAAAMVKANADVVLYGSPDVVAALSRFYDLSVKGMLDPLDDDVSRAYVQLYEAMRKDVAAESYPGFGEHANNIVGKGPLLRQLDLQTKLAQQAAAFPHQPSQPPAGGATS